MTFYMDTSHSEFYFTGSVTYSQNLIANRMVANVLISQLLKTVIFPVYSFPFKRKSFCFIFKIGRQERLGS